MSLRSHRADEMHIMQRVQLFYVSWEEQPLEPLDLVYVMPLQYNAYDCQLKVPPSTDWFAQRGGRHPC